MSYLLYDILGTAAYVAALPVLESLRRKGIREWQERLGRIALPPPVGTRIWIHAASVGELTGVVPLAERIQTSRPGSEIVFSTVTRTGQKVARTVPGGSSAFFLPLDVSLLVRRALDGIASHALILMETEIWPNLLREAGRRGMRVAIVNGRISSRSFGRYRLIRGFLSEVLERVDLVGVQSDLDRERFLYLGARPERVRVLGSTKYDARRPCTEDDAALKGILGSERVPVWVAGCVRPGEEGPILDAHRNLVQEVPHTLVLAPRHMETVEHLETEMSQRGLRWERWTDVRNGEGSELSARVLLVDTIGDLSRFYSVAAMAFVGGGLVPLGGHNPLEPAAFGIPVLFGKRMDNYRLPSERLRESGGGVEVEGAAEIQATVERWLRNADARMEAGARAGQVVSEFRGASDRALDALIEGGFLDPAPARPGVAGTRESERARRRDGETASEGNGAGRSTGVSGGGRRQRLLQSVAPAASAIHRTLSAIHRSAYRSGLLTRTRLGIPVVSVGNLALGGTGKTPLVALLATRFAKEGFRVAVLSRGYRRPRKIQAPVVVSDGGSPRVGWSEAGDEPYWLSRKLSGVAVLVDSNRSRSGRYARERLGSTLLLLDDGFQHLRLHRDLDIVLLDSRSWTEDGRYIGALWLREGLGALENAQSVILVHCVSQERPAVGDYLERRFPHLALAQARYRPTGLTDLRSGEPRPLSVLDGESVVAVSGLARPERFEDTLEDLGGAVIDSRRYPDHHTFRRTEIRQITRRSGSSARWIVTTEKDAVRMEAFSEDLDGWLALRVEMDITAGQSGLDGLLRGVARKRG